MPNLTIELPANSGLHQKLVEELTSRMRLAEARQASKVQDWIDAEERVLAYLPESDADNRRSSQRSAGTPKYTTIQIPYTYAVVMTMHTYLTSVFFSRTPVHQYAGRHGESEQQVQAVEALIDYQVAVGKALAPYYVWIYDALKYGVGILGTYWTQEKARWSTIELVENKQMLVTHEMDKYSGNKTYNVAPFDFYPDPRVPVGRFQEGEFCAVRCELSWAQVLQRKRLGYYTNLEMLQGGRGTTSVSQTKGSSQLERPVISEPSNPEDAGHPVRISVYEVYVNLVPSEWGLGGSDWPEKWVFTITEDYSTVIGAQPLGAIHDRFPFDVLEPEIEAYGVWNRGIPEVIQGIQETMDWLLNTHFYNVRAALNNQFLVDPSRVVMKDLSTGTPGLVLRIKPEAYGQDVRTFFQQVPVHDVTQTHMLDMNSMFGIGERMLGVNDQMFGALAGSGRRTATEIRTSTGFGTNRQKTITEWMSATGFSSHSEMMVKNSQQYYDAEHKLRIVGDLAMEAGTQFLNVTPDMIAGYYDFQNVDGTLPIDRQAQVQLWTNLFGQIRQMPEVATQYDFGRIFAWVSQLAGLKNVNKFRIQLAPDEALARSAERGNVVPLSGAGAGGSSQPPQKGRPQPGPTSVAPGL